MVGTGTYLDDLDAAIAAQQARYRHTVKDRITFIITLFISFFFLSLLIARVVSRRMQAGVSMFTDFVKQAALSYEKTDPTLFSFKEFQTIAEYTNHLVEDFRSAQEKLRQSQQEYQKVSQNIPVVVYSALPDQQTVPRFISGSLERLTGYDADDFIDSPELWAHMIHPEDRNKASHFLKDIRHTMKSSHIEYRITIRDGGIKWIQDVATSVIGANGELLRIDGFLEDITDRKLAEEALLESEKRYRQLFEGAGDAIYVHDFEGRFMDVNRMAYDRLGYTRNEILSKNLREIDTPENAGQVPERIRELRQNKTLIFNSAHVRKDGSTIPLEIRSQIVEYGGKPVILSIARDISERIRTEERRRLYEISLLRSQKMEAIGTLAGGIAHDFNNILAAIIGYAELALMDEEDSRELKEHLNEVLKAGNRARNLVKQILTFSRREEGEIKPVMIKHILKEALTLLRASLPSTIQIHKNISSRSMVLADPTQILQVIMNLCTNAAQAMNETGGTLSITLEDIDLDEKAAIKTNARQPGPHVVLTVTDTGCGIAPEIIERIFEPYFTTKEHGKGTGLGLALVHGIVTGNGGTVAVESVPGKGTTFRIYLPRIINVAETDLPEEAIIPTGTEKILFVDDEAALANLARLLLERLGYKVTVKMSSPQALELFRSDPSQFDLVITDVTMPIMTGDVLAREILKIRPDIPVILCTGYTEIISKEQAQAIGIRDYILKPIVKQEMARTVREVLDQNN